jgi:primosomal protein N' (replication factor Y) (superfamily II helicase)
MAASQSKGHKGLVYKVAVPSPLRRVFDYLPLDSTTHLSPGARVQIPFGNRKIVGFIVGEAEHSELASSRLKPITSVLDNESLFPQAILKLLLWCSSYYQHPLGEVLSTAIPGKLRSARPLNQMETLWRTSQRVTPEIIDDLTRAPKQKALLELLLPSKGLSKQTILEQGFTHAVINSLQEKELVEGFEQEVLKKTIATLPPKTNPNALSLNDEQSVALQAIRGAENKFECFLLDGVTGSGKTEVYMQAMQEQLIAGKQCLVLVPEIGLTPQTVNRFAKRFDCQIAALHSGMTDNERLASWTSARDGSAGIVIGTRSAVFTPLNKPGIIIVDEEHDNSFKQQDGFRYSARDIAVMRGREEGVPVILGSATPSLESLHNAQLKKFSYLSLSERAGGASPSTMNVVDTAETILDSGFSEHLLFKIKQHLEAGNQVLVFINRRGFAPILNCMSCGWIAECKDCIAQMTVHANPPSMRCHHCGNSQRLPLNCPKCQSVELSTLGAGTQKLEKYLEQRYSSFPVIRIDRDSTRSKKRFESMLDKIHTGEPCVLLGTQMLAKGHHFPEVTLVAIVDADSGLFSPDFRGQEFMAQTITQVAGRAGRAEKPGEVIIQSRHAGHKILTLLSESNYIDLAEILLEERKTAAMPPYSQLALIKAEAPKLRTAIDLLKQIEGFSTQLIRQSKLNIHSIGPIPAPMEKRAGRYRSHLLFNAKSKPAMQRFLAQLVYHVDSLKLARGVRWSLDVDPQEMI